MSLNSSTRTRTPKQLNPDGVSLKGCNYIYASGGQAGEYAPLTVNPYDGCGHRCVYCYVPHARHITREQFDSGAKARENYPALLRKDAAHYQRAGITEQCLISFTSDPYHPFDTSLTRDCLMILRNYGLAFCTLSKGGTRAFRDLDLFRPDRDAYAATLTTLDNALSLKFEQDAPLPADRIAALRAFHDAGIFTWVSLEPVLSPDQSLAVVEATHEFVDLFKAGRANYMGALTKTTDWQGYTLRLIELLNRLGTPHYIKKDLQHYLPPGYPNPLRVPQHH
jgi:DNA repair photolyase